MSVLQLGIKELVDETCMDTLSYACSRNTYAFYLGLPDFVGLNVALPKEYHTKLLCVMRLVLATYVWQASSCFASEEWQAHISHAAYELPKPGASFQTLF